MHKENKLSEGNTGEAMHMDNYLADLVRRWQKSDFQSFNAGVELAEILDDESFYQKYKLVLDFGNNMVVDASDLRLSPDPIHRSVGFLFNEKLVAVMGANNLPEMIVFENKR